MINNGIDISKYQGNAEELIKNSNFVIIRAGYGNNNKDSYFYKNVELCKKYNKPYGVYWFSYADTVTKAHNEAIFMDAMIKKCDYKPTLPVFIDWEADSERYLAKKGKTFTWQYYNEVIHEFCDTCEELGYYAGIYCDNYHYKHLDTKEYCIWYARWDNKQSFDGYDSSIWIKQYTVDRTRNVDMNILKSDSLINCIKNKHFNGN